MVENKRCKDKQGILDVITLLAVMQYVVFRFLQSTMFPLIYTDLYKYLTLLFLAISGGLRFVYLLKNKRKVLYSKDIIRHFFLLIVLAIPFMYVGIKHNYKILVFYPIIAFCLYDMDQNLVLKCFIWTIGILLASTIICCLAGAVRNITYGTDQNVWGAYGTVNRTDIASYFTFLLLFAWCSQKNRNTAASIKTFLVSIIIIIFVYRYTDSRTALYCGILTLLAIASEYLYYRFSENSIIRKTGRIIEHLAIYAFPIICVTFIGIALLYKTQNSFAVRIDQLLSGRIDVIIDSFEKYGLNPFGTSIQTMHGNGSTQIAFGWRTNAYGYIDTAYAMIAIRYGWVLLLIYMSMWMWMTRKALHNGEARIALSMAIIAFHAFSEARFLDINYNILLWMPLCSMKKTAFKVENQVVLANNQHYTKKQIQKAFVSIIICLVVGFIFPKLISWLRTIFYIKGWNKGIQSGYALVICIALISLIITLQQIIYIFVQYRKKKHLIFSTMLILILIIGSIIGNQTITEEIKRQMGKIESEEKAVNLVQQSASKPVYVAELSEIFQRTYGGFSEHIFTTEELYRSPQGSIFTDVAIESLETTYKGGQYCQVSKRSGLYSFDESVIKSLTEAGFEWRPYYYSERSCDLYDLSVRNGIERNDQGQLILRGKSQSINENIEYDQYWGTYEVRYLLELPNTACLDKSKTTCIIRIMGEAGDHIIMEQPVKLSDFDEEGKCNKIVSYHIDSTPKVSFLIIAEDGVEILVDEITWRRVL